MYAVVRSGARSYRVEEGGTITVDRRAGDAGETVILDQVLLFADGVRVRAGTPFVTDAIVTAQIAFTLILVIAAGLFVRTLSGLLAKGPGFDTSSLISFGISRL